MTAPRLAFFKQDILFLWMTATTALCLGLLVNQFRDHPLPLIYQNKDARLQGAVERLASAPSPAAELSASSAAHPTEYLTLEEFSEFVDKGGLVLDARPEIFHRLGHVPGAISLPRDDFENAYTVLREKLETGKTRPIVLYCSGSSCEDSELVKKSLVALGYTQVAIFKGGWSEWQTAGKPEEGGLP